MSTMTNRTRLGRKTTMAAGVGVAALAAAGALAAPAQAAPVQVAQIPATAFSVSGLVVPGLEFVGVYADQTAPGTVEMSAPARPQMCSASAAGALVELGYLNLSTGKAGGTTVKPCPNYMGPTPVKAPIHPGAGQIAMTIRVIPSGLSPRAGQPSLPGAATFTVR